MVDGQVVVPADATRRRGIQPVVSLTVNGDRRADATSGDELTFRAVAEVPEGTGVITEVAWDFDGSGRFADAEPVDAAPKVRGAPAPFPSRGRDLLPRGTGRGPAGRDRRPARSAASRTWRVCGWSWLTRRRADGPGRQEFLVDRPSMATDRLLDMVGRPGGPLADAALWHLEVVEAAALSPSFRRVVLTAPGIEGLQYAPGQDLMLRVPLADDKVVNRRYTIRSFDAVERDGGRRRLPPRRRARERIGSPPPRRATASTPSGPAARSRSARTPTGISSWSTRRVCPGRWR